MDHSGQPPDRLGHDGIALSLLHHIHALPGGSVIAIQAPWGRGKTDVLERAARLVEDRAEATSMPPPLWINPWKYGMPDLVSPLVIGLVQGLDEPERDRPVLRESLRTVLRAANAMLFKGISVVAPFGEVIGAASGPVEDLIDNLLGTEGRRALPDPDPVAAIGERFADLVEELLRAHGAGRDHRLVCCVDDLDRCLPDHQIAMLEALHFLTGAGARVSFLVAIDPRLVQEAAIAHYRTNEFDTNQYLDKIFDLRLDLPSLRDDDLWAVIDGHLRGPVEVDGDEPVTAAELFRRGLGIEVRHLERALGFHILPELSNPRVLGRIFRRLELFCGRSMAEGVSLDYSDPEATSALIAWITIAERWPGVRALLQALPTHDHRIVLRAFAIHYGFGLSKSWEDFDDAREWITASTNVAARLPSQSRNPDVGQYLSYASGFHDRFRDIDDQLRAAGL